MKVILPIFFCVVLLTTCSEEEKHSSKANTVEYFKQNLNADMDYAAIVIFFGKPARDIGSGIHIYVYVLGDSTEIWIGYTDEILYASHMDKSQQVLDILI